MLQILNKYSFSQSIPKTYATLLTTPRNIELRSIDPAKYFHLGLKHVLEYVLEFYSDYEISEGIVYLDLNIDGIPLYKSKQTQFWPILVQIKSIPQSTPFIIGIFCGNKKPISVESFLKAVICDLKDLIGHGLQLKDKLFSLKLRAVICDTPARAYVKRIVSHTAYNSCNFCIQSGLYEANRMYFPEVDH